MACVRAATIVLLLGAGAAAGCANPFRSAYHGVTCPVVSTAQVSVQAPRDAKLIGTADFISDTAVGNAQAVAAAQAVGANVVQWDRAFLRQDVTLAQQPLDNADGWAEPMTGEIPITVDSSWYRYHARFWRSTALGGFPPSRARTPPPPGESP